MKVLHITTGLGDGGAEAVLYRLCAHDKGHQHTVISLMDEGKYGPLLEQAGIAVHCLYLPRGRLRLGALFRLWQLSRQLRPDVVQTWMYHGDFVGGVMARLAGVRNVVWGIHNTTLEPGKSRWTTIVIARVSAWLSHWIPKRIAVCAQRAVEVHRSLGYDAVRMRVIPNGYNLSRFKPDSSSGLKVREEWGISQETPLLGMVARYDPQKDHDNLLDALKILRERGVEFCCVLVGTGMDSGNQGVVNLVLSKELQCHVKLAGQRNDVPAVMNALDLHVLSSAAEAFPNVLAEAMACGTPCVTTDVGDAAVIVGDTGWVVPPRDATALADGIQEALRDWRGKAWSDRKNSARERIKNCFSVDRMVDAYGQLWQESIAEN